MRVDHVDAAARDSGFSGVVRLDAGGEVAFERAYGLADRAHGIANTPATRFAIASATKGLTALTVMSLVEDGTLPFHTRARELLGHDLPLVDDRVTVEHLLAHRSGIGDYLDEDDPGLDVDTFLLPVPVGALTSAEAYLPLLDGHPQAFEPGSRFAYCNSGYAVLALLAERAAGVGFHDLVRARVTDPAGMAATGFVRSDALPGDAAIGYVADGRTNVHHLPVLGTGDGGAYTTVADFHALWRACGAGLVVTRTTWAEMTRPRSAGAFERHGLGLWLHPTGPGVALEGMDAGVSFRSQHDPEAGVTWTAVSNTTVGAWPVARALRAVTTA